MTIPDFDIFFLSKVTILLHPPAVLRCSLHRRRGWKPRCQHGTGVSAKGFGKKRGRKEDLRSWKGAAHGFRNLSVIKILFGFEQAITEMKIKSDEIVNSFSLCRNIPAFRRPFLRQNGRRGISRAARGSLMRLCSRENQRYLEQVAVHQQL